MPSQFSLRTLMLVFLGISMFGALLSWRGMPMFWVHTMVVLAFAIPGGSYGYDLSRTSHGAAVGACVAAVGGTLLLSAVILWLDYWRLFR